jgi:hypothetical protein
MRAPSLPVTLVIAVTALFLPACGPRAEQEPAAAAGASYLDLDDITPAERDALLAAEPVAVALAARDYGAMYDRLSSHARARMSVNQFAPEDDDAAFERHEQQAERDVTRERFLALLQRTEAKFGQPVALRNLHVHTSDPAVLSGRQRTGLEGLDTMLAIGNMPAAIPEAIRRASIRGSVRVQLPAAQLAEIAKAADMTVDELQRDPDFEPYFNFKFVVVDDGGVLRVAYFELMPPSMLD